MRRKDYGFKRSIKYGKSGGNFIQRRLDDIEMVFEYERDSDGNIYHNLKGVGEYIIMGKYELANKKVKIGRINDSGMIEDFDFRKNLYLGIMNKNEVFYNLADSIIFEFIKRNKKNYVICERCLSDYYKIFEKIKSRKNDILIYHKGRVVFSSRYYSKGMLSYIFYSNLILLEGYLKKYNNIESLDEFRKFKDSIISDDEYNLIKDNIDENAIKIVDVLNIRVNKFLNK